MCSTTERLVKSVPRIVLVTAVLSTGLVALACGDKSPLPCGGQGSAACGNPWGPSAPAPTPYALRGIVTDTAGVPLSGAKVVGHTGWGLVSYAFPPVLTGTDGRFETAPVAGRVDVHVSKDGYSIATRTVTASANELDAFQLLHFPAKTLVFTASPSCALSDEARSRRYTVEIEDQSGKLAVRVVDKEFVTWVADTGFAGTRDGSRVSFTLSDDPFGDWVFVELMAPGVEFALIGTATGTVGETGMSMTFSGRVHVRSYSKPATTIAECEAGDHRLDIVQ